MSLTINPEKRREVRTVERNMIISLIAGYITALLPIWNWDGRVELFFATMAISIAWLIILIWIQELTQRIKKALTSDNVRATRRII